MSKLSVHVCAGSTGHMGYVPLSFCIDQLCSKVRVKDHLRKYVVLTLIYGVKFHQNVCIALKWLIQTTVRPNKIKCVSGNELQNFRYGRHT